VRDEGEADVSGRIKYFLVAFSALGLLMQASPALASGPLESLAHARIRSVRLLENGRVRVAVRYVCSWPDEPYAMSVWITQRTFSRFFRPRANCDGIEHKVVRRPRLLDRQPIDPQLPINVHFSIAGAEDSAGYFVSKDGQGTRAADAMITEARLNQQDELVVAMSYKCPTGWAVMSSDPVAAELEVHRYGPHRRYFETYWHTLQGRIVCDGTAHTIVRRFGPDEDWRTGTHFLIWVRMEVAGRQGGTSILEIRRVRIG
jgi:hypothetical protein